MRIAFMSWRDLANEQAGGSEVFIDRLAVALQEMGHEVAHLCGGPMGVASYPVFNMGGTYCQYVRAPFVHHRVARDWDLLVDTENGLPYFSRRCGATSQSSHACTTFTASSGVSGSLLPWPPSGALSSRK